MRANRIIRKCQSFLTVAGAMVLTTILLANLSSLKVIITPDTNTDIIYINEMTARKANRRNHLQKKCSEFYDRNTIETKFYLINRQYRLIWCYVHKAASSAWMYNFNILANYTHDFLDNTERYFIDLAKARYAIPSVETLRKAQQDSISFIIVRHPLDRLHSAYNDRILNAIPGQKYDKIAKSIIETYRKIEPAGPVYNHHPTFEEFVRYLIHEAKTNGTLNPHWMPYTDICSVCEFNLDIIVKMETIQEDQKYLIELAGIQDLIVMLPRDAHKSERKNSTKDIFSTINRTQLRELHEIYKYDFLLFNYTIDEYVNMVQDDGTEWTYD